jgi:hypothetical protein
MTITKQDGKIMYVTVGETYIDFKSWKDSETCEEGGTQVSGDDLKMLSKFIDCVQFGTITLRIKSSKIVGVEKNVKIKL